MNGIEKLGNMGINFDRDDRGSGATKATKITDRTEAQEREEFFRTHEGATEDDWTQFWNAYGVYFRINELQTVQTE